jgi:hypothetical protein
MTDQEVLDKIVEHLQKQGRKSTDSSLTCLYRGPEGTKCALGIFLTDEEVETVRYASLRDPCASERSQRLRVFLENKGIDTIQYGIADSAQRIHDQFEPEQWPERFYSLASNRGLDVTLVKEWCAKPFASWVKPPLKRFTEEEKHNVN